MATATRKQGKTVITLKMGPKEAEAVAAVLGRILPESNVSKYTDAVYYALTGQGIYTADRYTLTAETGVFNDAVLKLNKVS